MTDKVNCSVNNELSAQQITKSRYVPSTHSMFFFSFFFFSKEGHLVPELKKNSPLTFCVPILFSWCYVHVLGWLLLSFFP